MLKLDEGSGRAGEAGRGQHRSVMSTRGLVSGLVMRREGEIPF